MFAMFMCDRHRWRRERRMRQVWNSSECWDSTAHQRCWSPWRRQGPSVQLFVTVLMSV